MPEDIARRSADRLYQRPVSAEVALLVGVEDADERHLRQVQPLAKQVDADQHIEDPQAEVADDLDPLQRVDVAVQVPNLDPRLAQIVGEVLGHLLGQRGDQAALVALDPKSHLRDEVVDLPFRALHLDRRIDEAGRPDDLLHDERRVRLFVWTWGRARIDDLPHHRVPFRERERAVVDGGGEAESIVDQRDLAGEVALVHAVDLRHGHVGLVDDDDRVVGQEVEQAEGALPLSATREVT